MRCVLQRFTAQRAGFKGERTAKFLILLAAPRQPFALIPHPFRPNLSLVPLFILLKICGQSRSNWYSIERTRTNKRESGFTRTNIIVVLLYWPMLVLPRGGPGISSRNNPIMTPWTSLEY